MLFFISHQRVDNRLIWALQNFIVKGLNRFRGKLIGKINPGRLLELKFNGVTIKIEMNHGSFILGKQSNGPDTQYK